MQTYVNPYTPMTPIGAGLQNMALALFSGRGNDGKADLNTAHMGVYDAQRRKYEAEAAAEEAALAARGDGRLQENAALLHQVPVPNVRAMVDYSRGNTQMPPAMPGGVDPRQIAETIVGQRLGTMDKTVNANEIAKAIDTFGTTRTRGDVISGSADPTRVGQGYFAVSGKAPFDNMGGTGTFNQATGDQTLNEVGLQRVAAEAALAGQRRASAGEHGARTRQIDLETRSGVKLDAPPVLVNDPETGPRYTSAHSAVTGGMAPAAKPTDRKGKEAIARALTSTQSRTLAGALDGMEQEAGAKFDAETRRQLTSGATQLATDPNSEFHQDPVGALDEAIRVATGGKGVTAEKKKLPTDWFVGTKVLTTGKKAPAAVEGKPASAVPAPAQRVKGETYQTPRGLMRWTGTGWVPADA